MLLPPRPALTLALVALLAGALAPAAVWAGEAHCRVPMADWQPREAVQAQLEAQGLTVRRIRIDDGCYEVDANDAQGLRVKLRLDPATLEVLGRDDPHDEHDEPHEEH